MFAAMGLVLSCGLDSTGGSLENWKKDRPICSHVAYVTALQNASSVASTMLTTESVIADIPEKTPTPAAPGMDGGMGGMY